MCRAAAKLAHEVRQRSVSSSGGPARKASMSAAVTW